MTTCTHCNTPQQDTHHYRTSEGVRAICNPCVANLVQMLPRYVGVMQDVTPMVND
ncbi:MAG TPA: hypothetical protein VNW52_13085 [Burkholderiaceae bacterium]|jgi:hypothetical protein|nr:hypothetical protein [Burkholderiaceae bacterium]